MFSYIADFLVEFSDVGFEVKGLGWVGVLPAVGFDEAFYGVDVVFLGEVEEEGRGDLEEVFCLLGGVVFVTGVITLIFLDVGLLLFFVVSELFEGVNVFAEIEHARFADGADLAACAEYAVFFCE